MILLACATRLECQNAANLPAASATDAFEPVRIRGRAFLPCQVGIGPVAAALSVGALLERHPEVTGILNLGICGSFDMARAPLGSTCIADAEIWPEYGVRHSSPAEEEVFGHRMFADLPLDPPNRLDLDPIAQAAAMGMTLHPEWTIGPSLTVAGVSGDPQRAQMLRDLHGGLTENMEGFSLALAARRKGIAFLEIRTVSNPVGARDKRLWNFKLALNALQNILPVLTGGSA
jgi:futalosine hydrolase